MGGALGHRCIPPRAFGHAARLAAGEQPGIATAILVTVLATALLPVEISAPSLSYRELATREASLRPRES